MVLLSAAGLFLGHLSNLYAGLGFDRGHVLLVTLDPSHSGYQRAQLAAPYETLLERIAAIPGVRSATLSAVTPISGRGANRDATVEGYQPKPGELRFLVENWVGPKYFETYGTPLLAGRDFRFADAGGPRVAIVNRTMARHYFGDASPIGKHVLFDGDDRPYEIIGVVGDAKYEDVDEPEARLIYFNAFQEGQMYSAFAIRTSGAPGAVAGDVRRMMRQSMQNVPVSHITTLADQVDAALVPERLVALLSELFGMLGALLRRRDFMACSRIRWRGGRTRSGCGWRWALPAGYSADGAHRRAVDGRGRARDGDPGGAVGAPGGEGRGSGVGGRVVVAHCGRRGGDGDGGPDGGVPAGAPRVAGGPDGGAALRIGVAHALVRAASPLLATQAEFAAHPEKAGTLAEAEPLDA